MTAMNTDSTDGHTKAALKRRAEREKQRLKPMLIPLIKEVLMSELAKNSGEQNEAR